MEVYGDPKTPNLLGVDFWDEGVMWEFAEIKSSRKNREGRKYASSGATKEGCEDAAP